MIIGGVQHVNMKKSKYLKNMSAFAVKQNCRLNGIAKTQHIHAVKFVVEAKKILLPGFYVNIRARYYAILVLVPLALFKLLGTYHKNKILKNVYKIY